MIKLLIIADDLTGALDTGVQFAKNKIATSVSLDRNMDFSKTAKTSVLVIDSETRHVKPEEAFQIVYDIVLRAKEQGTAFVYKKVDSVLRGNIGAELDALAQAWKAPVCFAPAFPRNDRKTVGGVQLFEDVPVHKTIFGADPFEPVKQSFIPDIIAEQSSINVFCSAKGEEKSGGVSIDVFDAASDNDLQRIALEARGKYEVFAGCAGFAEYLRDIVPFEAIEEDNRIKGRKLLVVSGSLNEITLWQLQEAGEEADLYRTFSDRQLFDEGYLASEEAESFLQEIEKKEFAVLFAEKSSSAGPYEAEISAEKKREIVSGNLGKIAASAIQRAGRDTILAVFGGDTLYGTIQSLGCPVRPLLEIMPGVAAGQLETKEGVRYIITKSGGFGERDILKKIYDFVKTSRLGA